MLAITGITGHSGGFLLEQLKENHYSEPIRCMVRKLSITERLDNSCLQIEKMVGDLSSDIDLESLVDGAETVLHIASIFWSLRVVDACRKKKVKRVILVHTTGIFSKYKMAAEEYNQIEQKLSSIDVGEMQITILRPTMIFGDIRQDHNIHKFIRMVDKLPVILEINHGAGLIQPVNARDLGRAYYQVVTATKLPEKEYILSGQRSISIHELFLLIGKYLGKEIHIISCPMWFGVFLAKALKFCTIGKVDYIERVLRMGEDRNYEHLKATRDFGYSPENFDLGLKREVLEYRGAK